jgi:hypothetical protein
MKERIDWVTTMIADTDKAGKSLRLKFETGARKAEVPFVFS